MQTQNVTASHQQTGSSYLAVTLCLALPHLAKTPSNPKTLCRKIGDISSKIYRICSHSILKLTFHKSTGMLNKDNFDTLTRVERTEYESGNRQRSETEWKFGMDILPLKTPS